MESRKIIKFGNSSYVITLPYDWIQRNQLEKGSSVLLGENGTSLFLSLPQQREVKTAEIVFDDKPLKLFNRELISYYLKNYDYIKISGKQVIERLEELRVLKEKLSSIEIIEINEDHILLKDLTSPNELNVTDLIKEIVDMEKVLFSKLLKDGDENKHYFISNLDTNINKLAFLGYKTINYNLDQWKDVMKIKDTIHHWRTIGALEHIGDIIKRVARYLREENINEQPQLYNIIKEVSDYFSFITSLLNQTGNLENNLKVYLDKKQSILRELENTREQMKENMNLYLVIMQLLKDIIGQLDAVILSIIDTNHK